MHVLLEHERYIARMKNRLDVLVPVVVLVLFTCAMASAAGMQWPSLSGLFHARPTTVRAIAAEPAIKPQLPWCADGKIVGGFCIPKSADNSFFTLL